MIMGAHGSTKRSIIVLLATLVAALVHPSAAAASLHPRTTASVRSRAAPSLHPRTTLVHPSATTVEQPRPVCIPEERSALLAFKAGIIADPQGMLSLWVPGGDCCSWGSSRCDSSGHIMSLYLSPDYTFDDESHYLKGLGKSHPFRLKKRQYLSYWQFSHV